MADRETSEAYKEFVDNRLSADLADAFNRIGGSLEDEFTHAEPGDELHDVPQGLARELLDVMDSVVTQVNALSIHDVRVDSLLEHPVIDSLEGEESDKRAVVRLVVDVIAEAVAEAVWRHRHGTDVTEDMEALQAIDQEKLRQVDEEWNALHDQLKADFGL